MIENIEHHFEMLKKQRERMELRKEKLKDKNIEKKREVN